MSDIVDKVRGKLYHASEHEFQEGDIVSPRNFHYAYATTDPTLASEYGSNLYEVSPVDEKDAYKTTRDDLSKWKSKPSETTHTIIKATKGFKIHRAISKEQFKGVT